MTAAASGESAVNLLLQSSSTVLPPAGYCSSNAVASEIPIPSPPLPAGASLSSSGAIPSATEAQTPRQRLLPLLGWAAAAAVILSAAAALLPQASHAAGAAASGAPKNILSRGLLRACHIKCS